MKKTIVKFVFVDENYKLIATHIVEFETFLFPIEKVRDYMNRIMNEYSEIHVVEFEWMR